MSISIRAVQALQPGSVLWDTNVRGFGVRRQRRDAFYVLKYRSNGKQRFLTIGRHGSPWTPETARREAQRLLGAVASGADPAAPSNVETLEAVIEAYLRQSITWQRPNSHMQIARYLRQHWAPLHGKPINEVQRKDVAAVLRGLEGQTAVCARMALSTMFNWAIREGYDLVANPVQGTNRPKGAAQRERVLSNDELAAVWRACGDDDFGRIVRLLMLTGQRRNEVGEMEWNEIVGDVWTIPASRTKNGRTHTIPLTSLALSLLPLAQLPVIRTGRIFTIGSWSRTKARLDAAVLLPRWTLHDLRRTCATGMADLGVLPHIVEAVLNHVSGHKSGVAGIYNRARYADEVRDALERWSVHVAALVE
jgi:integrase